MSEPPASAVCALARRFPACIRVPSCPTHTVVPVLRLGGVSVIKQSITSVKSPAAVESIIHCCSSITHSCCRSATGRGDWSITERGCCCILTLRLLLLPVLATGDVADTCPPSTLATSPPNHLPAFTENFSAALRCRQENGSSRPMIARPPAPSHPFSCRHHRFKSRRNAGRSTKCTSRLTVLAPALQPACLACQHPTTHLPLRRGLVPTPSRRSPVLLVVCLSPTAVSLQNAVGTSNKRLVGSRPDTPAGEGVGSTQVAIRGSSQFLAIGP